MKKRLLCFLITVCVSLCFFTVSATAALTAGTVFKASLNGEMYGIIGEKYVVTVDIGEFAQSEFLGVTLYIDYDADVFEIDSAYLGMIEGTATPESGTCETYPLIDPEEGWVLWGNNSVIDSQGTFTANILNDSSKITSLKGDSVSCFVEFKVKSGIQPCESVIKIDTDGELTGVFSETLIESKPGTGSSLSVNVVNEIPSAPSVITLKDESLYVESTELVEGIRTIYGFREKTVVADLISNFVNEADSLRVIFNEKVLTETDIVPTNAQIQLLDGENVIDSVLLVCIGDVDSSGTLDSTDYIQIKSYFLGKFDLSEVAFAASDIDHSGIIDSTDYLRMKSYFLGTLDIYA